jgi:hypothetical protein
LDEADVAQELWVEAVISAQSWRAEKHASLTTYLWPKLKWRALKTLHKYMRQLEVEHDYALTLGSIVTAAQRETLPTVVARVRGKLKSTRGKLKSTTLQVFDTIFDPPAELFLAAEEATARGKVDLAGESRTTIKDFHIAYFLGVSAMTVSRSMKQIKKVLEAEVHGDQEKGQRKNASR